MAARLPASPGTPFQFRKCLFVPQALGLRAATLDELLRALSIVDEASVYFHLHRPYVSRVEVRPEFPGEFAIWVGRVLGEPVLAERLAALDPIVYSGRLHELKLAMCCALAEYLVEQSSDGGHATPPRRVPEGQEFCLCTARLLLLDSQTQAHNLRELRQGIETCGSASVFYHMFDTIERSRGERDDFSQWTRFALQEEELADELQRIDPYDHSLEETRALVLETIDRRLER